MVNMNAKMTASMDVDNVLHAMMYASAATTRNALRSKNAS
jgi:hypothetical protein